MPDWLQYIPVPRPVVEKQDWIGFIAEERIKERAPVFAFELSSFRTQKRAQLPFLGEHYPGFDLARFPLEPALWPAIAQLNSFLTSKRNQQPFLGSPDYARDPAYFPFTNDQWPAIAELNSFLTEKRKQLPFLGEVYQIVDQAYFPFADNQWAAIELFIRSFITDKRNQQPVRGDISFINIFLEPPFDPVPVWGAIQSLPHSFRTIRRPQDWRRVADPMDIHWIGSILLPGIDVCIKIVDFAVGPELRHIELSGIDLIDVQLVEDIKHVQKKC